MAVGQPVLRARRSIQASDGRGRVHQNRQSCVRLQAFPGHAGALKSAGRRDARRVRRTAIRCRLLLVYVPFFAMPYKFRKLQYFGIFYHHLTTCRLCAARWRGHSAPHFGHVAKLFNAFRNIP